MPIVTSSQLLRSLVVVPIIDRGARGARSDANSRLMRPPAGRRPPHHPHTTPRWLIAPKLNVYGAEEQGSAPDSS